jgi:hypothetical protein
MTALFLTVPAVVNADIVTSERRTILTETEGKPVEVRN